MSQVLEGQNPVYIKTKKTHVDRNKLVVCQLNKVGNMKIFTEGEGEKGRREGQNGKNGHVF